MFDNAKNPLILQTKFEDFQRYTHEALFQFPKKERFLLCGQIQTATDEAMQLIIRFRLKYYKKTTLEDVKPRVMSFLGYTKHCQARQTTESALQNLICQRGE